jgi:NAD(P)-dependent dehydrogenase (short-subunit alcohol dehydrogenase family)
VANILEQLFSVRGKTAVVTGGAKGVGAMISTALVRAGARVIAISRSAGEGERFAAGLAAEGDPAKEGSCSFIAHDLASAEGTRTAAAAVAALTPQVHILVNNAGAFSAGPIDATDESRWDFEVALNLRAPFFLTKTLLPQLEAAAQPGDPARVINIGSIAALWAKSNNGAYAYGAAKAGIHHLTRMLASDLTARGVNVNAIAPGFFPSDMTQGFFNAVPGLKEQMIAGIPSHRLGTLEDVGGSVIFLSSRAGAYLSGAILPLEGGLRSV